MIEISPKPSQVSMNAATEAFESQLSILTESGQLGARQKDRTARLCALELHVFLRKISATSCRKAWRGRMDGEPANLIMKTRRRLISPHDSEMYLQILYE